mmetsp:Transcript_4643/g.13608  ORF Transcript_4643/g.13608 Transcript_4643/m.13608 type:complete len:244 (+) Transcript_4643:193-924(+)
MPKKGRAFIGARGAKPQKGGTRDATFVGAKRQREEAGTSRWAPLGTKRVRYSEPVTIDLSDEVEEREATRARWREWQRHVVLGRRLVLVPLHPRTASGGTSDRTRRSARCRWISSCRTSGLTCRAPSLPTAESLRATSARRSRRRASCFTPATRSSSWTISPIVTTSSRAMTRTRTSCARRTSLSYRGRSSLPLGDLFCSFLLQPCHLKFRLCRLWSRFNLQQARDARDRQLCPHGSAGDRNP